MTDDLSAPWQRVAKALAPNWLLVQGSAGPVAVIHADTGLMLGIRQMVDVALPGRAFKCFRRASRIIEREGLI